MASMVGMWIEYKAKTQEVDAAFNRMNRQIDSLKVKQTSVQKGFDGMSSSALGLASALGAVVTAFLGYQAIKVGAQWLTNTADAIDRVTDSARGLGVSAQALQALGYSASLSGVSVESLETALKKTSVAVGKGALGDTGIIEAFKRVGVEADKLRSKPLEGQFLAIADGLMKIKDPAIQNATAMQIFGKSFIDIMKLIKDDAGKGVAEFQRMGLALSDAQRVGVDKFGDSATRLGALWQGTSQKVAAYMAPAFEKILSFIGDTIEKMGGIDKAAKSFADAIVSGVTSAIKALNSMYNLFLDIKGVMVGIEGMNIERKLGIAESNQPKNPSSGYYGFLGQDKSYMPSIASAMEISKLQKELATNQKLWTDTNNAQDKIKNGLSPLINSIEGQTRQLDFSIDTTKKFNTALGETAENFAKTNTVLQDMIKSQGAEKLKEILGKDKNGEKMAPLDNPEWNETVRQIYDKAINGGGGYTETGSFNGKDYTSRISTAKEDLSTLEGKVQAFSKGGSLGEAAGYIGVIEEMRALIKKIDPASNKVKLDIEVKTEEGFALKIAQSEAMDKQMKSTALDLFKDAAKMGAK